MKRALAVIVLLGLISSVWVLLDRARTPQGGTGAEVVVSLEAVYESSRRHGLAVDELLRAYREAGVTTLAIERKKLTRLERAGQVAVMPESELRALQMLGEAGASGRTGAVDGSPSGFHIAATPRMDSGFRQWLIEELAFWAPRSRVEPGALGPGTVRVHLPAVHLEPPEDHVPRPTEVLAEPTDPLAAVLPDYDITLGLSPADVALARKHGFLIAAFVSNQPDLSVEEALFTLRGLDDGGDFSAVFFNGPEALGWPDPEVLRAVAERLDALGVPLVVKRGQAGARAVAAAAGWQAVRIQPVWDRIEPERFARAARERNARFLYLGAAFFAAQGPDWLDSVTQAIGELVQAVEAEGLGLGRVAAAQVFTSPPWAVGMTAVGIVAGVALAFLVVFEPIGSKGWRRVLTAAGALGAAGAAAVAGWGPVVDGAGPAVLARLVCAFAATVVFPTLGVYLVLRFGPARAAEAEVAGPTGRLRRLGRAAGVSVLAGLLAVVGGVLTAGMGADTSFVLQLNEFRGTKLSLLLVPAAGALLYLGMVGLHAARGAGRCGGDGASARDDGYAFGERSIARRALDEVWCLMRERVVVGHVILAALLAAAGFVYLMRSGNLPLIPVGEMELALRRLLGEVLTVRPRFKEFLIGYPALVLLMYWGWRWRCGALARWAGLLAAVAASVGLISVGNTFVHFHTPISVDLWRTVNGLLLGLPLGFAAVAAGEALLAVYHRAVVSGAGGRTHS